MNANAYGGELGQVLEWVRRLHRGRQSSAAPPGELGFAYRRSNLGAGGGRRRGPAFALRPRRRRRRSSARWGRCAASAARPSRPGSRPSARPSRTPTTAAEGRTAGQLLEAAGCQGLQRGGARFAPKHANFVENTGEATTADVLELMAEGRRRVHERFGIELEPEVQVLGEVDWPEGWELCGEHRHAIALPAPRRRARLRLLRPRCRRPGRCSRVGALRRSTHFWFRDSSLVAVRRSRSPGVGVRSSRTRTAAEAGRSPRRREEMTTLHVSQADLVAPRGPSPRCVR